MDIIQSDLNKQSLQPTLLMETSWEVCNKVGGIYTVLSTRAATMIDELGRENVLFIGPRTSAQQRDFKQSQEKSDLELQECISARIGMQVLVGSWEVPGNPQVILVDYSTLYGHKDRLYFEMWEAYAIQGDRGYGDYDVSCLFAIASACVMRAYLGLCPSEHPLAIFNEWTTGMGLLYTKLHTPQLKTMFITHATTVGRSIAGNGKPLYSYLQGYNGDQMAEELNVVCKHVVEKLAAHQADVFGTVSEVTAREAAQLLERDADVVVYNGFEQGFIPNPQRRAAQRRAGRQRIIELAEILYGETISTEALIVATSGRNEYRNKGLDLYIDAMRRLSHDLTDSEQDVVALILVPGWVKKPRIDLHAAIEAGDTSLRMQLPYLTHELNEPFGNKSFAHLHALSSKWGRKVFPILIPAYLDGHDGIINIEYYDLLPALDLTVFASYYEPWGYTPLESIAFDVPTITTDKAGFGVWARAEAGADQLSDGVLVVSREDDNFVVVAQEVADQIRSFAKLDENEVKTARKAARQLAHKADWKHFYPRYEKAFSIALSM